MDYGTQMALKRAFDAVAELAKSAKKLVDLKVEAERPANNKPVVNIQGPQE